MSNDEAQRKMDFILNQQAQFSADIEKLKELHAQSEKRFAVIENTLTRIASATLILTDRMTELAAAEVLLDRKMVELADSQNHTDQRLNALIDMVKDKINGQR